MKTKQSSALVECTTKVPKVIDFSNKALHVGIDVHKSRREVAVFLDGVVLSNVNIAASSEVLIQYLRRHYGDASFYCVYECGPWRVNLCRWLWAAAMECIVLNPADIPDTDKERRGKTDPIDAPKMARHHAAGILKSQC
jgi:transposase